jgi:hypothetical protein
MATDAHTAAGTKLYVSASLPATYDAAGYAALSWTEVQEVTAIGDFGAAFGLVTHTPLNSRVVHKFKGSVNYGQLSIAAARDVGDTGQGILETAAGDDDDISFKIEHNDSLGSSNTIEYTTGKVMSSLSTGLGSAEGIDGVSYQVEINNPIVKVEAT